MQFAATSSRIHICACRIGLKQSRFGQVTAQSAYDHSMQDDRATCRDAERVLPVEKPFARIQFNFEERRYAH